MAEVKFVDALRDGIAEEMRRDKRVFVMGEDVVTAPFGSTAGLVEEFGPRRVLNTPISESGFVGVAIGAAMTGMRPIVDLMLSAFVYVAMDQLVSNAAKIHSMFNGQYKVPLTCLCMYAAGGGQGAQHAECAYPKFLSVPGIKIVLPCTPYAAKGLVKSAVRDDNPVLLCYPMEMMGALEDVPDEEYAIPLGRARIMRSGEHATIAATGAMVSKAVTVAEQMADEGISVEVIDLQSLVPLDEDLLLESVEKTGRLVVVDEGFTRGGVASEIAAVVQERAFDCLDAPIMRVASFDAPVPVSPPLERFVLPNEEKIARALRKVLA